MRNPRREEHPHFVSDSLSYPSHAIAIPRPEPSCTSIEASSKLKRNVRAISYSYRFRGYGYPGGESLGTHGTVH